MNVRLIVFVLSILIIGVWNIFSQQQNNAQGQTTNNATQDTTDLSKDYYPLAFYDQNLLVTDVNYVKRHAENGRGDIVDVSFNLKNRSFKPGNYAVYVLAAHESNLVSEYERKFTPFPTWRVYDREKDTPIVKYFHIAPDPSIDSKTIWGEERIQQEEKKLEALLERGEEGELANPTFTEILHYLNRNQDKALSFTLYGEESPEKDKRLLSNYVEQTEEEKKKQEYPNESKHTYTILAAKYLTNISTHHFSEYRPGSYPINKVAILIFNKSRKKNNLVYREIKNIGKLPFSN